MNRLFKAAIAAGLVLSVAIAGSAVQDWSTTPSSNNAAPPNGAPEGMSAASVNDVLRQVMADVAVESQVNRVRVLNSVAGTNTITASMTPSLAAYSAGMVVVLTPANSISGAATLNVNALGALDVQKYDGDALASGDLVAGVPALVVLDSGGDDWILLNPQTNDISAATILSRLITVDGAGSGLDADLLDGQSGAYYQSASNLNAGTVPSGRLSGTYSISISGNAATATTATTATSATSATNATNATNADTVDGQHAAAFAAASHAHSAADVTSGTLAVARGGTGVTSSTGTGNVVLSASPTFTGTVTAATVNATTITGNGAGLTALDAGDISAGTLAIARGGTGQTDGTTRNITGKAGVTKTLSTSTPSGGSDGDIWYRY